MYRSCPTCEHGRQRPSVSDTTNPATQPQEPCTSQIRPVNEVARSCRSDTSGRSLPECRRVLRHQSGQTRPGHSPHARLRQGGGVRRALGTSLRGPGICTAGDARQTTAPLSHRGMPENVRSDTTHAGSETASECADAPYVRVRLVDVYQDFAVPGAVLPCPAHTLTVLGARLERE